MILHEGKRAESVLERGEEKANLRGWDGDEKAAAVPLGNLRCEQIRLCARVSRKEPPPRWSSVGGGEVWSEQGEGNIVL